MYNEKECCVLARLEAKRIKYMYYNAPKKFRNFFRDFYKKIDNDLYCRSYSNATTQNVANYFININENKLTFEYEGVVGSMKLSPSICEKICEVMLCQYPKN